MAFWWPLLVLAFAYAICRFLFMLIPPNVPSIDVDVSEGTLSLCLSLALFLCVAEDLRFLFLFSPNGSVGGCESDAGEQLHLCELPEPLSLFLHILFIYLCNLIAITNLCEFFSF